MPSPGVEPVVFFARLVSLDPPVAAGSRGVFSLARLTVELSPGDWGMVRQEPEGPVMFRTAGKTSVPFPGPEWRRLQQPDAQGHTRMEALRFRHRILRRIREYFDKKGFLEVETPLRVPSCGVETHLTALESGSWFLSPSPEFQMKRLLAGGSGSIYQICRAFRSDETGARHNPEFTMLEWYSVGADTEQLRAEVEQLIVHVQTHEPVPVRLPEPPYPRMTMSEAFLRFANVPDVMAPAEELLKTAGLPRQPGLSWEEAFFSVFVERVEPHLTLAGPVFLTAWPAPMASLARLLPEDPRFADRFEFFAKDLEIANGFGELLDADLQRTRSEGELVYRSEHGMPEYPLDERFLEALAEGCPPVSGIALGVDRLIMLWWGAKSISRVLTFTQDEL